ncbi:uncharacterized protein YjbJ (UPF0337 family) [Lipingzhangella halophila]|uniref:Uncharacterized protein YjbJ (UPF0337 family) n=1 Tax=Lipingzhangella halophila TaxID=1783352 RepID=A0A7W7RP84_9ACTN|nr:hypothetical protein [Lipingzhangella halophila]MBB4935108.1 uncharacterized protein YjbJ (UPF0337 family) [Lipingzhangella halophila]
MFQLACTSAKAAIVAAGAAGFVAAGAGIASADEFGVTDALRTQPVAPSVPGLPADPTGPVDQVQRDVEVPQMAHTLPAPGTETPAVPGVDASGAEDTLGTVQDAAGVHTVHQTAPQARGLAHGTVNSLPAQALPGGANGAAHSTLNRGVNSAEQVNHLSNELPQPEAPAAERPGTGLPETGAPEVPGLHELPDPLGTVSGVPETLLPQDAEQTVEQAAGEAPDLDGAAPESPEEVKDEAGEVRDRGTDTAEGTVDHLVSEAPADVPDAPDTGDVDETAGEAKEVDSDEATDELADTAPSGVADGLEPADDVVNVEAK